MTETALLRASQTCGSHEGGDPCDADWQRYRSAVDRYQKLDMLGDELQTEVRKRAQARRAWTWVWFALTVVSLALSLLSLLGMIGLAWLGVAGRAVDFICDALSLYDRTVELVNAAAGTFSFSALIFQLEVPLRVYRRIMHLTEQFKDARLLFVGSGQLRFAIGDCGIAIAGNSSAHMINWSTVARTRLVKKDTNIELFRGYKLPWLRYTFDVEPGKATHLLVEMKSFADEAEMAKARKAAKKLKDKAPLNARDILVIPAHFFHAPRDGDTWREFLRFFHKHACIDRWVDA